MFSAARKTFSRWLRYQQILWRLAWAKHRLYSSSVAALSTGAGVSALVAVLTYLDARRVNAPGLSLPLLWAGLRGLLEAFGLWWLVTLCWFRLRAPFTLDESRTADLEAAQATSAAAKFKVEELERSLQAQQIILDTERNKLLQTPFQPSFRFVPGQRCVGAEAFDALELWNDGEAVVISDIQQASYLQLRFSSEPNLSSSNAYRKELEHLGLNLPPDCMGSLVGERYSHDSFEALIRHPSNPLHIEDNRRYVVSMHEDQLLKYVASPRGDGTVWDATLLPMMTHLGIVPRATPVETLRKAPEKQKVSSSTPPTFPSDIAPQDGPGVGPTKYIPSYCFHRRDYELGAQTGLLVTFYAWQDGNPGTNYTKEYVRLAEQVYRRFGFGVTIAKIIFFTIRYVDRMGGSGVAAFEIFPPDPWGAVVAKRVKEDELFLSMRLDVDMKAITAASLLDFCNEPPAFNTLISKPSSVTNTP